MMSVIDRPGRWRQAHWPEDRWFDARHYDGDRWQGVDKAGTSFSFKGTNDDWTYLGPLPDAETAVTSDEESVKRFYELVIEGRIRWRLSAYVSPLKQPGEWEKMPRGYEYMVLPPTPPTSRITIEATGDVIASIKAMEGVEVVE